MVQISLKKRQYFLLILAALLLAAVIYRYAPGLSASGAGTEQLDVIKKRLAKYQELKRKKARLEKEAVNLDRQLARTDGLFLRGETPSLAAVDLQNKLKSIAGKSNIKIESLQVINPPRQKKDEKNFYQKIPIKISADLTVKQLKEILYSIADSPALLRVTRMNVKYDSRKEWLLKTDMTVTGLRVMNVSSQ